MSLTRPQFFDLSEAEVWAAVEQDDGPVAAEVTRLVATYTKHLLTIAISSDAAPDGGLLTRANCPIERVALHIILTASVQARKSVH